MEDEAKKHKKWKKVERGNIKQVKSQTGRSKVEQRRREKAEMIGNLLI